MKRTLLLLPLLFFAGFLWVNRPQAPASHSDDASDGPLQQTTAEAMAGSLAAAPPTLPQDVWAIFQDSKGRYWFGSNGDGVYCWEGDQLRQITTQNGLVSNTIRGIQEDHKGHILVETVEGVSKFNGLSWTTLPIIRSVPDAWQLHPHDLWFKCNGNAQHVYRYDGYQLYELQLPEQNLEALLGTSVSDPSHSPYSVYGINKDQQGHLWLGTVLAGAFRFDGESFLWVGEPELSRLEDGRVPGVRAMLEDRHGMMWLSNFKQPYRIHANSYEVLKAATWPEELVANKVLYFNSGIVGKTGDLWMTTYGGGVWKYDGEALSNVEIHKGTETVLLLCIHQDRDGVLWLGSRNHGIYRGDGTQFEKFELPQ